MSAHARIAYCGPDETVTCINLYTDAIPEVVGDILFRCYTKADQVKKVIERGDLLILEETPEASVPKIPHHMPRLYGSLAAFLNDPDNENFDYLYVFKEGRWVVVAPLF